MNRKASTAKIWTIIRHEYISKVKSKGFIISTILGPLILIALIAIPIIITMISMGESEKKIAIIDLSNKNIGQKLVSIDTAKYILSNNLLSELRNQLLNREIDGYLFIPVDITTRSKITIYTRGGGGIAFIAKIEKHLSKIIRHERLSEAGLDPALIDKADKGIEVQTEKLTEAGTKKDYAEVFAGIGYFLGFLIYMMMFMYGSLVMRAVIEEKANRIIEVIASSAKPFEIMFGKVVGIGAVGLTQVIVWVVLSLGILSLAGPVASMFAPTPETFTAGMPMDGKETAFMQNFEMPEISIWLILGFIFYFLSGYFIYSTLFAAVGSAVDQEADAQQLMTPVTLPIIIPILFIGSVISNPDGALAVVLSLIPLFSPILMIVRVAATDVPIWQILLSVILMVSTFLGCLWLAAKIYRTGILMYGKKPTFKDIFKWLKLAK